MANNLEQYARDLIALTDGQNIMARHYDHSTGRMTHPASVKSRDIIIASGLHALYLPVLQELYDVSVYLDMDENLRRYLKIQRDVQARGHAPETVLASLDRREPDAERFIRPQKGHADIIFSVAPRNQDSLKGTNYPVQYQLAVMTRSNANERELTRMLMSLANLHVDTAPSDMPGYAAMVIGGEISGEDVGLIAQKCCTHAIDFLDSTPQWQSGVLGLMQLITLFHLEQVLVRRLVQ
jgi:uridine kinase